MSIKFASLSILFLIGLTGCLSTQTKTGLARPDFSQPAPVKSSATVKPGCHCSGCGSHKPVICDPFVKPALDLTTPPEPKKGKKIIGELPDYQAEDDKSF